MENEGIPVSEYEAYADQFKPKLNAARDWAVGEACRNEVHGDDGRKHHGGL